MKTIKHIALTLAFCLMATLQSAAQTHTTAMAADELSEYNDTENSVTYTINKTQGYATLTGAYDNGPSGELTET